MNVRGFDENLWDFDGFYGILRDFKRFKRI